MDHAAAAELRVRGATALGGVLERRAQGRRIVRMAREKRIIRVAKENGIIRVARAAWAAGGVAGRGGAARPGAAWRRGAARGTLRCLAKGGQEEEGSGATRT